MRLYPRKQCRASSRAHPRRHGVSLYRPSTLCISPSTLCGASTTLCSTPTTLCTRVGTEFHRTNLVAAHCPALKTGMVLVRSVPSALASTVLGLK